MQHWKLFFYLLTTLLSYSGAQEETEDEWSYGNQPRWEGECTVGQQQSPIRLSRRTASTEWSWLPFGQFDTIDFLNYDQTADGNFSNTGHTVQMTLGYDDPLLTPQTVVTTDGNSTTYYFRSLHFHWPSEHEIDGEKYPLELHLVHTSQEGKILVLGYLFEVCDRSSSGMQVVGASVRRLVEEGSSVSISQFAPQRLLPRLTQCDFFQYTGSLTTPPCTEGVTWLVYREPLCVEQWELNAFDDVTIANGTRMANNFRQLQPINDREIIFHGCSFVSKWRWDWWWWWW